MNATKKQLIHTVFKTASLIGKKFYMSEMDYKAFVKACTFIMNDGEICNAADYTSKYVIHNYRESLKINALFLDYNSIYGGYMLNYFYNTGGAVDDLFTSTRYKATAFVDILQAFNSGQIKQLFLDGIKLK